LGLHRGSGSQKRAKIDAKISCASLKNPEELKKSIRSRIFPGPPTLADFVESTAPPKAHGYRFHCTLGASSCWRWALCSLSAAAYVGQRVF